MVFAVCLAGCATDEPVATTPPTPPRTATDLQEQGQPWWPSPAAVRVFPSTRFVRESGQTFLEARIELLDAMGDPTKWPGEARFELLAASGMRPLQTGERLYHWRVPVVRAEAHRLHYDSVTRTYLFRLIVDNADVAQRATALRVEWSPLEGARLSDVMAIEPPGQRPDEES